MSWSLETSRPVTIIKKGALTRGVMVQLAIRIEGKIRGFDEFMNLVVSSKPDVRRLGFGRLRREQIDDAVEVKQITKTNDKESRRNLGMRLAL